MDHMTTEEKLAIDGISCDPILMFNCMTKHHQDRMGRAMEEIYTTVS